MSEDAAAGAPEPAAPDDRPVEAPPSGSRVGLVIAAVLAIAASGGLAWWFASAGRTPDLTAEPASASAPAAPPAAAEAPAPLRLAAAEPDPDQVRRAWGDVQQAYSSGGPEALVRASQLCARGVTADPQSLDYCLAYDIYASTIVPPQPPGRGDWLADAGDRDLALARTALPEGVSPDNRLAQVAALTKAVLPKAQRVQPARHPTAHPKPRPVAKARHAHRAHKALPPKLRKATPHRPHHRAPRVPEYPRATRDRLDGALDLARRPPPGDPLDPPH